MVAQHNRPWDPPSVKKKKRIKMKQNINAVRPVFFSLSLSPFIAALLHESWSPPPCHSHHDSYEDYTCLKKSREQKTIYAVVGERGREREREPSEHKNIRSLPSSVFFVLPIRLLLLFHHLLHGSDDDHDAYPTDMLHSSISSFLMIIPTLLPMMIHEYKPASEPGDLPNIWMMIIIPRNNM